MQEWDRCRRVAFTHRESLSFGQEMDKTTDKSWMLTGAREHAALPKTGNEGCEVEVLND